MTQAETLWATIQKKAGTNQSLSFTKDTSLPLGAYKVSGNKIRFNGYSNNPGDVYAVAAIAIRLFNAIMVGPAAECISLTPGSWQDLTFEYTPQYSILNFFNVAPGGWERVWFHWHHIPTHGKTKDFNTPWMNGLCKKYPQLAPTGTITDTSKPNILHPEFPEIMHAEYVLRGEPYECSLVYPDGNGHWWALEHYPPLAEFNPYEVERWKISINLGFHLEPIHSKGKVFGKTRYFLTDTFYRAIKAIPADQSVRSARPRFIYTNLFVKAYKAVESYFHAQGAFPRFMINAYNNYFYLPLGTMRDNDLSNFDVYYTSPKAVRWTESEMMRDVTRFNRWKQTGAQVIWRPNLLFFERLYPLHNYRLWVRFMNEVKSDGYMITGYTPAAIPASQGMNYFVLLNYIGFGNSWAKSEAEYLSTLPKGSKDYFEKSIKMVQNDIAFTDENLLTLPDLPARKIALMANSFGRGDIEKKAISDYISKIDGGANPLRLESAFGEVVPSEE